MDNVKEGRTYYEDADGNEITKEEYEKLQGIESPKEEIDNVNETSADSD
jgi:hypothetical protein